MPQHESVREPKLRRTALARIYDVGETTVLLAKDGRGHELTGDSARLARAVLAFLVEPRTRAEILAHLEALTGGPIEQPDHRRPAIAAMARDRGSWWG